MSQEFWYSRQPDERFKGFERQKFSTKLSNKLRSFFYGNQGEHAAGGPKKTYQADNNLGENKMHLGRRRSSENHLLDRFYSQNKNTGAGQTSNVSNHFNAKHMTH